MDHSTANPSAILMDFARTAVTRENASSAISATTNGEANGSHQDNKAPSSSGKKRARDEDSMSGDERNGSAAAGGASCESCRLRKVKCDRQIPCSTCTKRGQGAQCVAESEMTKSKAPRRANYALASDVERLTQRLAEVEAILRLQQATRHSTPYSRQPASDEDELAEDDGVGLENAASNLEGAVLTAHLPGSHHRAIDSLPFADSVFRPSQRTKEPSTRLQDRRDSSLELTSALTSILAPPIDSSIWWSSAAEIGLDPFLAPEEIMPARLEALNKVLRLLPNQETTTRLVLRYFDMFQIVQGTYKELFLPELDAFFDLCDAGRRGEVDPLWLSVLFIVLAISASDILSTIIHDEPATAKSAIPNPHHCYAAARKCLHLGDWSGSPPKARVIQTTIVMAQWVQVCSLGGEATRLMTWIAGAIRVAQALGLHQLGGNPETMPPDDPSWPPGKNARKRQFAIRLFSSLRLLDHSICGRYRSYLLHPHQITTDPPANVSFSELSNTDWHVHARPLHVVTEATFDIAKLEMSDVARKMFDFLNSLINTLGPVKARDPSHYDGVLELDRGFHDALAALPPSWQLLPNVAPLDESKTRWYRHCCTEGLHHRLVKLHRPWMTRGQEDKHSRFAYSTEQCVKSARIVIESHHSISSVTTTQWFSYSHTLAATLVVFADLFHAIDQGASSDELDKKSNVLVLAFGIFSRHAEIASPVLRRLAATGAQVMSGLFFAEKKRRSMRDNGQSRPSETFAQILQQITRDLDAAPVVTAPATAPSPAFTTSTNSPRTVAQHQISTSLAPPTTVAAIERGAPAATTTTSAPGEASLAVAGAVLDDTMFDWSWLETGVGLEGFEPTEFAYGTSLDPTGVALLDPW